MESSQSGVYKASTSVIVKQQLIYLSQGRLQILIARTKALTWFSET